MSENYDLSDLSETELLDLADRLGLNVSMANTQGDRWIVSVTSQDSDKEVESLGFPREAVLFSAISRFVSVNRLKLP